MSWSVAGMALGVVAVVGALVWGVEAIADSEKRAEDRRDMHLIECVERTDDVDWCMEVLP